MIGMVRGNNVVLIESKSDLNCSQEEQFNH